MLLNLELEKTLESPLDCKEIQAVHPKENRSWMFIGRTDIKAETPLLWPPNAKSRLIWKDPDAGKDWRREEKGMTEDEVVGWHHRINGHEFESIPGVGDRQGGLAWCSPCGCKESDTTEQLNWIDTSEGCCKGLKGLIMKNAHKQAWHITNSICLFSRSVGSIFAPMDCSPPGFFVCGFFQARILEWFAISYSRQSSQPTDWTHISWKSPAFKADSLPLSH